MEMKGICSVLLLLLLSTLQNCRGSSDEKDDIRLPRDLSPIHYLVRLQPFVNGNFSFNGYIEYTFEVKDETDKITMHIADIITKNDTAKVYPVDDSSQVIGIKSQEFIPKKEFYIVTLENKLEAGKVYVFSLFFQGLLNDQLKGFYRSSYKDNSGKVINLATTQFEPTDARRAFPCLDEPDRKAKFSIEMIREDGLVTTSNMPLYETVPADQDGWFIDRFNTTLPMSTYLVAFIVSDFGYLQSEHDNNTYKFRVWARKSLLDSARYAVELGPKVSHFYETYFNVPFPLPKQDMAAVPDFSAGAMENWGLIIYRESSFLYDPKVAKAEDRMRAASTIAHELAHQWFGDLVTPAWWNDLWLNEGFATYMEYLSLNHTEPSLKPLDVFGVNELQEAFSLDCLESSHPISVEVGNPDEINSIFDSISYSKGASVLRMMSNFLTEKAFTNGLTNYLTELSYSNAKQDDLWKYLTDAAHSQGTLDKSMTVKEVMDTWTLQMGYPVITVHRNEDGSVTLTQNRFLLANSSDSTSTDKAKYKWWIPITYTSQSNPSFEDTSTKVWMSPSETTKTIQNAASGDWIIVNLNQVGYYRVNYDDKNWETVSAQLSEDPNVFPGANRAQFIDDSLNLARAGLLGYEMPLELLKYLGKEPLFTPLESALHNLEFLRNMFVYSEGYGSFKNYLLSLITPLYDEVKFADSLDDPHLEQRKRALVLTWACDLDHEPCVKAAVDLYNQWMNDPENTNIISPNLKSIVYCTAIRKGGAKEWKFAWDRFMKTNIGTEQKELLEALGCTEDIWILGAYLNRSLSADQGIKKQFLRYIVPAIASNPVGRMVSWQFLRDRWDDITESFGSVGFVLDDIMASIAKALNTNIQLSEMEAFKEKYKGKFSSAERSVVQGTENIKHNIRWMERYYSVIINWFQQNGYKNDI